MALFFVLFAGCSQILGFDDLGFDDTAYPNDAAGTTDRDVQDSSAQDSGVQDTSVQDNIVDTSSEESGLADSNETGMEDVGKEEGNSPECTNVGPAYIHGDLWGFWHNIHVACDAQNRWLWLCQKRLGQGKCSIEAQRFQDCWTASGDFPPTTWGTDATPHSPSPNVCQPNQYSEKNVASERPGNPVPCDTKTFDYDSLRQKDPFYGADWMPYPINTRHLTLKVFAQGQDPLENEGQSDAMVVLSTDPSNKSAYTYEISNHSYPTRQRSGGCLPPIKDDVEKPFPSQNFGAFFWLEVPTDEPVTLMASWIGPVDGTTIIAPVCSPGSSIYSFPASFGQHGEDGKPWFISSPCWDIIKDVQLEPGRHYLWNINGLQLMPDCSGPPDSLLQLVPSSSRASFKDGTCSSM
ncbi:MAG: hypothetical protein BWY17_01736 [Deltaproteobacteria bacterium ADurb.Bin207]|jgi:hypothetical protein|nr:MAG: hypothetical protein BWY17_01736 [Deltaproteobacteria bacterium ADurb.Bin207]